MGAGREAGLRELPAVHELAARLEAPHALAVAAARAAIAQRRAELTGRATAAAQAGDILELAVRHLAALQAASLRRVINATGVIVHTNLGRAPLPAAAARALAAIASGYSNLEYDLDAGARGARHDHLERILCDLTGAEAAAVVNNGAGAVLLAVAALAGTGGSVVVSRGELVEIGGGFRIPEVVAHSGARLIEVGTTNRTRLEDYARALAGTDPPPAAILRVHQSNFRAVGFVESVPVAELCRLGPPVIDDVGSGALALMGLPALGDEPAIEASVAAGAALVCCSGDKLLGGPQAGLLVGRADAVRRARAHPLARALRIDKLSLAALEATLMLYRDPARARAEIPVLAMLEAGEDELAGRAERIAAGLGDHAEVVRSRARVGGGALPLLELEGPAVALAGDPVALAAGLRAGDPPVLARIHEGRVLLDPRTVAEDEVGPVVSVARVALRAG